MMYEVVKTNDGNNFGVGDEDFTDRLNSLLAVLAEWESV